MNNFLNKHTNIMGLQFGRDKCVKLHVGKLKHKHGCNECKVDAWEDKIVEHKGGQEKIIDADIGKEIRKNVETKKVFKKHDIN